AVSGATLDNSNTVTINGTATIGTLALTAGSVSGSGNLTVTADYSAITGTLGTTFNNLELNKAGTLTVGAAGLSAVESIKVISTGGIILNGRVTASSGTGDAIVLAGASLTNNVGASALSAGGGRWILYSARPDDNTFGGLLSGSVAVWGRSYPTAV